MELSLRRRWLPSMLAFCLAAFSLGGCQKGGSSSAAAGPESSSADSSTSQGSTGAPAEDPYISVDTEGKKLVEITF